MENETNNIKVAVKSRYLPKESDARAKRFVFAYTVTIENLGTTAAQLISRHWWVTDANDEVQEVQGKGVIGKQPTIAPGQHYTYSSGVILKTETGTMKGSYQMRSSDGHNFDAEIPGFALVPPHRLH